MSKPVAFIEASGSDFLVGAECPREDDGYQYRGPVARISFDEKWLHINTDDHEGDAMLNIEALPLLRLALALVHKKIRTDAMLSRLGEEKG